MKLAVFHNLPSGGALRVLHDKMRRFKENGHTLSLYSFSTADHDFLPLERWADRAHIEPLSFGGFFRFRRYFKAARAVASLIDRSDADFVYVTKCRYFGSPPLLRYLRKPHVFYSHEPLRIRSYESRAGGNARARWTPFELMRKAGNVRSHFIVRREDRRSIRSARRVMTNSSFTAGWLKRVYGVEAEVNYQGVDAEFFHPSPVPARGDHVLSVGRIDETKGHDFLLRALSRVPAPRRPALVIVCDRFDRAVRGRLEEEARRLGVRFEVRCRVGDEELREFYRTSRLVLCASANEPFGLVPLEAMACGVPVIAVREGGFLETVADGRTGFLLERDEALWARTVEECLSDPARLRRLGEAGRAEVLRQWTWGPFIERFEQTWRESAR
jgi:glycosyltransferase involved in cell wall biosynthesis